MAAQNRRNGFGLFAKLVIGSVLLGVMAMTVQQVVPQRFTRHSKISHKSDVERIEDCFNGNGTIGPTYQMPDGRWGQWCRDKNNNKNFWRIMECEDKGILTVVTQFVQRLSSGNAKLFNYIKNKKMIEKPIEC